MSLCSDATTTLFVESVFSLDDKGYNICETFDVSGSPCGGVTVGSLKSAFATRHGISVSDITHVTAESSMFCFGDLNDDLISFSERRFDIVVSHDTRTQRFRVSKPSGFRVQLRLRQGTVPCSGCLHVLCSEHGEFGETTPFRTAFMPFFCGGLRCAFNNRVLKRVKEVVPELNDVYKILSLLVSVATSGIATPCDGYNAAVTSVILAAKKCEEASSDSSNEACETLVADAGALSSVSVVSLMPRVRKDISATRKYFSTFLSDNNLPRCSYSLFMANILDMSRLTAVQRATAVTAIAQCVSLERDVKLSCLPSLHPKHHPYAGFIDVADTVAASENVSIRQLHTRYPSSITIDVIKEEMKIISIVTEAEWKKRREAWEQRAEEAWGVHAGGNHLTPWQQQRVEWEQSQVQLAQKLENDAKERAEWKDEMEAHAKRLAEWQQKLEDDVKRRSEGDEKLEAREKRMVEWEERLSKLEQQLSERLKQDEEWEVHC